ncbi:hypothetical protein H0H87_005615 [Tephrocybe sp. NHM501043]|nr:hypothetical protein H0H87_005615 [Tephrocybe sp. NHM501043]
MSRPRSSSITLALYPIPKSGDMTHPLLWSDMPEELPELSPEEAAALTWDQVVEPTGPEFDREKLLTILALKNNPTRTPKRLTVTNDNLEELSASESEEHRPASDSEDDSSDLESENSEASEFFGDNNYSQELDIDLKPSLDDLTPKVSKIQLWKAQQSHLANQPDAEVCQ